ncbi:hypothetical protein SRRS_13130 [Sporomusa rhizae]
MVEPRVVSDIAWVFGISRPKIGVGSEGSALVGGKIGMGLERLCGSPTAAVWSQGIYVSRAKTATGCEQYGSFAVGRLQAVQ